MRSDRWAMKNMVRSFFFLLFKIYFEVIKVYRIEVQCISHFKITIVTAIGGKNRSRKISWRIKNE